MTYNKNNGDSCKFNPGVACDQEKCSCEKCGWNPAVEAERKAKLPYQVYGRTEETETARKVVLGTVVSMQGAKPAPIAASIIKNGNGDVLALEYSAAGMVLAIPADYVLEMLNEGREHELF